MNKNIQRLIVDILVIIIGILIAFYLTKSGWLGEFVMSLGNYRWIAIFISGIFFTSFLTAALSVVLLGTFAMTTPIILLGIFGGLGAAVGDFLIFRFVKDRIYEDIKYLLSFKRENRFLAIFKTGLFKFLLPFIAALIIASPFPDEIGITILGLSKMKNRVFLLITFILNGIGIVFVGLAARAFF